MSWKTSMKIIRIRTAGAPLLGCRWVTLLAAALLLLGGGQFASPISVALAASQPLHTGDILVGTESGLIRHFQPSGTLVGTLNTTTNTTEAGMCADHSLNLFTTNFGSSLTINGGSLSKFDSNGNLLAAKFAGPFQSPESCVFDRAGTMYVGEGVAGNHNIYKIDPNGHLLTTFQAQVDGNGTDWIDLAADQCTLYYTSESNTIKRFNVCTNTQLSDFVQNLTNCYALRIRPNGEVLVACASKFATDSNVFRLSATGQVLQTYDPAGAGHLFGLSLDPDGTTFWTGDQQTGEVYHVAIASGALLGQFSSNGGGGLNGLFVFSGGGLIDTLPSPRRIVDTRNSGGPIQTGSSRCFGVAGVDGIPVTAAAVVLNITAVGYGTNGWLTVYPAGQPVPATSTLNFDTHEYALANAAIMRLGTGGQVCVSVGTINSAPGSAQIILDATGDLTASALLDIPMLTSPQRVVDTRSSGGPIASGASRCYTVAGVDGIPANAAAVVLNVAAVGYATNGWLTVYPNGQAVPTTHTLNFDTHEYAIANGAIVRIGTGGQLCIRTGTVNSAAGASNAILDVAGYLTSEGLTRMPVFQTPQRVVDTTTSGGGPIVSGQSRCFSVGGISGIPANASSVLLNVTALGYGTRGWLTVYPGGQGVPATSTLNFDTSEYSIANTAIIVLGPGGQICVNVGTLSGTGSSQVIIDAIGYQ